MSGNARAVRSVSARCNDGTRVGGAGPQKGSDGPRGVAATRPPLQTEARAVGTRRTTLQTEARLGSQRFGPFPQLILYDSLLFRFCSSVPLRRTLRTYILESVTAIGPTG